MSPSAQITCDVDSEGIVPIGSSVIGLPLHARTSAFKSQSEYVPVGPLVYALMRNLNEPSPAGSESFQPRLDACAAVMRA